MDLRAIVEALIPALVADLQRLVAIPSVSADPARAGEVRRSAEAVAALLSDTGCPDVRIVSASDGASDGAPAVLGRFPAPPGAPTVCLYAHHDVQPTGNLGDWTSDPFVATASENRLFGRGSADDKGGIVVHLAALRAFDGRPPVGVTVFVEGEEEVGSPTLGALLEEYRDDLTADVYVICDSDNFDVGVSAFTTSLRGIADCVVEVRTLDHAVHSGSFGGVAPDALTSLCRLLATLHDEAGDVAIAGLVSTPGPDLDYPIDRLRAEAGLLDGVDEVGSGSAVERLWTRPAISVIGLDTTAIAEASNTLLPVARAKVSLRVAPGDNADRALGLLRDHLVNHAPWGAHVSVSLGETGQPCRVPLVGPYADAARTAFAQAWGREPVTIGQGGSIPLVAEFAAAFPDATILITAVADPDSRAHGPDESLHLGDLACACVAEALMLEAFGALALDLED